MTTQEAMENFVFPDEIKAKLMNILRNIYFRPLKLWGNAAVCIYQVYLGCPSPFLFPSILISRGIEQGRNPVTNNC